MPGPMRMQGWEGSLGSWKLLTLRGTEERVQSSDTLDQMQGRELGIGQSDHMGEEEEDRELQADPRVL